MNDRQYYLYALTQMALPLLRAGALRFAYWLSWSVTEVQQRNNNLVFNQIASPRTDGGPENK